MSEEYNVATTIRYEPTWLAHLFHSFPHMDLTFKEVNSTFNPQDARYRESLVFWAALPILWLLLTLLLFLVYFCYRCCQRDVEKKQDVPCLRWSLAVLAIFTCGAIGVGFYGNELTNNGVKRFKGAVTESEATIEGIRSKVVGLSKNVNDTMTEGIEALRRVNENYPVFTNEDRRSYVEVNQKVQDCLYYARQVLTDVTKVNQRARKFDVVMVSDYVDLYSFYRWLGTIVLLGWMVLLCLLLLLGVGLSSKCTLLVFCAFGIFTLVLCWLAAGFHMGISVGVGDFCVAPDVFLQKFGTEPEERSVIKYYVKCDQEASPFEKDLKSAIHNLKDANDTLSAARRIATDERSIRQSELDGPVRTVIAGLNDAADNVRRLHVLTDCQYLHKDYNDGIEALCYSALPGLAFLLLSTIVMGLFFTALVLLASKAWRHFTRSAPYTEPQEDGTEKYSEYVYNTEERVPLQNVDDGSHYRGEQSDLSDRVPFLYRPNVSPAIPWKGYMEVVEDDDPFLPRPDASSPSYIRYGSLPSRPNSVHTNSDEHQRCATYTRGRHGHGRETMQLQQRGSTPPPAYNSNTFYRTGDNFMMQQSIPDDQGEYARETIA